MGINTSEIIISEHGLIWLHLHSDNEFRGQSPASLKEASSDELLQEIEADLTSLESEYDFSSDIDSEILLVPDFDSELAQ